MIDFTNVTELYFRNKKVIEVTRGDTTLWKLSSCNPLLDFKSKLVYDTLTVQSFGNGEFLINKPNTNNLDYKIYLQNKVLEGNTSTKGDILYPKGTKLKYIITPISGKVTAVTDQFNFLMRNSANAAISEANFKLETDIPVTEFEFTLTSDAYYICFYITKSYFDNFRFKIDIIKE